MACRELIFSYRLDKPPRTVRNRVELLLEQIMWSGSNAWDPVRPHLGTPEGKASLEHYQNWLQGFSSFSQAKDARLGRAYMATQVIAKVRICIDGDWLQEPYWVVKDRDHDFCRMGWAIPSDVSCEDCEVQFWESCPRMNEGQSIIIVGLNRFLEGKINKLDESGKGKVGVVGQYGVTYMPHEDFPGIPDLVDE